VRANGTWAVAAYLPDEHGKPAAYGIMVLTIEGGLIGASPASLSPPCLRPSG
jgi:hypothetical protein